MTTNTTHFLGIPCACLYDCGTLVEVKLGLTCKMALRRLHP
jgi:hypothetical protein